MRDVRKSQFTQQSACKATWHLEAYQNEKDTTQGHQRGGDGCQEPSHILDLALFLPVLSADRCALTSALWDSSCELLQETICASKVLQAEERAQHFYISLWFYSNGALLFCYLKCVFQGEQDSQWLVVFPFIQEAKKKIWSFLNQLCGFLPLQGHVVRNWKVRWFVLLQDKLLYYKIEGGKKEPSPKGRILLDGCTITCPCLEYENRPVWLEKCISSLCHSFSNFFLSFPLLLASLITAPIPLGCFQN